MDRTKYTPDAICRAMGLRAFADDHLLSEGSEILRLLLTPSFCPELCITIANGPAGPIAEVRTFTEMFWNMPTTDDVARVYVEKAAMWRPVFVQACELIHQNIRTIDKESKGIGVLDGMGANIFLHSPVGRLQLEANVGGSDTLNEIVADLLVAIHSHLPGGECRTAVAEAGEYVGLKVRHGKLLRST